MTNLSANQDNGLPISSKLKIALNWFVVPGPAKATRSERRTYYALSVAQPPGLMLHLFAIFLFSYLGVPALAIVNVFSVILWIASIILLRKHKLNLAFIVIVFEVTVHAILVVYYVGWGSGAQYYLLPLMVAAAINHWKFQSRLSLAVISAFLFLGLYYYALGNTPQASVDPFRLNIINIIVSLPALLLPVAIVLYPVSLADRADALLEIEYEKSEALLLNILPEEIASRLKSDQGTIADYIDGTSVLFADVVHFTPLSAKMTPEQLVDLLNEVFSDFDALTEKYKLEKIKTIGDCYMVASGVPSPRADHAQVLVKMALEMQEHVTNRNYNGHKLAFRIGINSGPVVAGVIGHKKFSYDLWGDTVNTASRMESHGTGGSIQITHSTYELIKNDFICLPQGVVDVKGKGEMDVWFVTGLRNVLPEKL